MYGLYGTDGRSLTGKLSYRLYGEKEETMKYYYEFMKTAAMWRYMWKTWNGDSLTKEWIYDEMIGNLRQAIMWKWEWTDHQEDMWKYGL